MRPAKKVIFEHFESQFLETRFDSAKIKVICIYTKPSREKEPIFSRFGLGVNVFTWALKAKSGEMHQREFLISGLIMIATWLVSLLARIVHPRTF